MVVHLMVVVECSRPSRGRKRCKFEELQAASRKLERRLYEEDEHLRANKERPGRCFFISDLERIILHLEELCTTILNLVKYLAFEK